MQTTTTTTVQWRRRSRRGLEIEERLCVFAWPRITETWRTKRDYKTPSTSIKLWITKNPRADSWPKCRNLVARTSDTAVSTQRQIFRSILIPPLLSQIISSSAGYSIAPQRRKKCKQKKSFSSSSSSSAAATIYHHGEIPMHIAKN